MTSEQSISIDLDDPSTFPEHQEGFVPVVPDTLIRVTEQSSCGDSDLDGHAARVGVTYTVEGFAQGPDGDDPNARAYYLLDIPDHSFGGNYWAYPEHVEVYETVEHRAAARQQSRAELTPAMLVKDIVSSASSLSDIGIDEVDWSAGDGTATIAGRTEEGVAFFATVKVVDVQVGF